MPRGIPLASPALVPELAARLGGACDAGLAHVRVSRVAALADAADLDLAPLTRGRYLTRALASRAGALLVSASLADRVPPGRRWVHPDAGRALAELLAGTPSALALAPRAGVHPRAVVEEGARVHPAASVGAGAVVLAGAEIGEGAVVGPNAVVCGGVRIGAFAVVGAGAVLGRPGFGWIPGGAGEPPRRVPQLGGVEIEEGAEVGPLSTVDAGTLSPTVIGRFAKLDAQVHVGHNAEIGAFSMVAAQAGFAGSARLGEGALVGGQAGFSDHVEVGEGARVAAKSGVIGDVAPRQSVAGYPAVARLRWLRGVARTLERGSEPASERAPRKRKG